MKFLMTVLTKIIQQEMNEELPAGATEDHEVEELSTDEHSSESTSVNEQSNSERHGLDEEVESTGDGRHGSGSDCCTVDEGLDVFWL